MSHSPIRMTIVTASAVLLASCAARVRVVGPAVYDPFSPPPPAVVAAGPGYVVQVRVAPPPLPIYEQPPCPVVGWMWTPGYWAWGPDGYYWVPGTWVAPPRIGVLWTPGYWGLVGGAYVWHVGYWGPHVGFYGGVNYGFGYAGVGFAGGRWVGNSFAYNRSVTNVTNVRVTNVYNETVINNTNVTRVSYNGGAGGTRAAPTAVERMAEREPHSQPTPAQQRHIQQAQRNPALSAKTNGGQPPIAATPRPAAFRAPNARAAGQAGFANRQGGPRAQHQNAARKQRKKPHDKGRQHKQQSES